VKNNRLACSLLPATGCSAAMGSASGFHSIAEMPVTPSGGVSRLRGRAVRASVLDSSESGALSFLALSREADVFQLLFPLHYRRIRLRSSLKKAEGEGIVSFAEVLTSGCRACQGYRLGLSGFSPVGFNENAYTLRRHGFRKQVSLG
jgi:hypothetical protein